jgi:hypothetical protein
MRSERLLSVSWWTKVFSVLAILGLATMALGFALASKKTVIAGLALCGPLLLGGGLALVLGVPYVLWTDPQRRRRNRNE